MKRSTIALIVLLAILLIFPFIFFGIMIAKFPKISIWDEFDSEKVRPYNIVVHASDTALKNCGSISLTTYKGFVDKDEPVKFIADGKGFDAELQDNTIIVTIDSLSKAGEGHHFLTIEIPYKAKVSLINTVPGIEIAAESGDFKALKAQSSGNMRITACNVAGVVLVDTTHVCNIDISGSNIGGLKINGKNKNLQLSNSNIGTLTVGGTCESISLNNNNIGVCSWNEENQQKADINNSIIATTVNENTVTIDIDDSEDADTDVTISAFSGDSSKIRTGIRIDVNDDNRNNVEISPKGIKIDGEDGEHVHVSPSGIQVKQDGKEIVSIGYTGIKINK